MPRGEPAHRRQLPEDQIQRLRLQAHYEEQKAEISGRRNQTSFTFHGLRDQSVHNIFERTVLFALDEGPAVITHRVRETIDE